jgi:hypothetical protein
MALILRMYKTERRMQSCLRNPRIACNADHISNTARRTEIKIRKSEDIKKTLFTFAIRVLYSTHQGLSNTTTFRPI